MTTNNERGSLSLEQVLFIGALTLITTGLVAFYTNLGSYFNTVQMPAAGDFSTVGGSGGTGGAGGGGSGS